MALHYSELGLSGRLGGKKRTLNHKRLIQIVWLSLLIKRTKRGQCGAARQIGILHPLLLFALLCIELLLFFLKAVEDDEAPQTDRLPFDIPHSDCVHILGL